MKCRYNHCKNNNEVKKEEAIKEGSAYYCPECYKERNLKQQIEQFYSEYMPPTTIQILRKVINQLLYTNNYDADYILFVLNKIHKNKLKINNPFGVINYCNDLRNFDDWKKLNINKEYKDIKNSIMETNAEKIVKFDYRHNEKKFTDLI